MSKIIEISNVTYKYPLTKKPSLNQVNCQFEEGKVYGIIGENASGKTTLCNLIRGLIPFFYDGELEGDVSIDGVDVRKWNEAELSIRIGYVFQNPFTQISGVKDTVFEEVGIGLENLGVPKEEMLEKIISVCKLLKIEDLIQKNPMELSGGQCQRVAFASIIAMDSKIIVIDEPTSQLDPEGTKDVFEIIKLLRNAQKTIILVEHKVDMIAQYCDEVLVMKDGTVLMQGDTRTILTDKRLFDYGAPIPQAPVFGHRMEEAGKPLERIPITNEEAAMLIRKRKEKKENGN